MVTRRIFIPKDHQEMFVQWLDITDTGDSILLYMYNINDEGANLEVKGKNFEVACFMRVLDDYLHMEVV
jgi:hypothetical protein